MEFKTAQSSFVLFFSFTRLMSKDKGKGKAKDTGAASTFRTVSSLADEMADLEVPGSGSEVIELT